MLATLPVLHYLRLQCCWDHHNSFGQELNKIRPEHLLLDLWLVQTLGCRQWGGGVGHGQPHGAGVALSAPAHGVQKSWVGSAWNCCNAVGLNPALASCACLYPACLCTLLYK